jgi:hypothetical protein
MFSITLSRGLYLLSTGLAEASIAVRALRVQMMPALAMLTCSSQCTAAAVRLLTRITVSMSEL